MEVNETLISKLNFEHVQHLALSKYSINTTHSKAALASLPLIKTGNYLKQVYERQYYYQIRKFLKFHEEVPGCCVELPHPEESVLVSLWFCIPLFCLQKKSIY
jgi:hypothetical protein